MAIFKPVIILTLVFVAGILARLETEDVTNLFSFGKPIVINLDTFPSNKFEAFSERQTRANLIVGNINCDVRVYNGTVFRGAVSNQIQVQDYVINAPVNKRISYIAAIERASQTGSVFILNGGIGHSSMTLRFQSAVSRAIDYTLEVWSR